MRYLAFDLGAESGRAIVGILEDARLTLEEVYRFPNEPVRLPDGLHWDVLRLFHEMKEGLRRAVARYGTEIKSLAVDTWGVDFGLLGEKDVLLGNPYHYRDGRTQGMMEEAFKVVSREEIFQQTGIQFMPINSLYQLLAWRQQQPAMLSQAQTLLMMPDLFNFFFTGIKAGEFTIASTTQMYNPRTGTWATGMLEKLGLPVALLPAINPPGTIVGPLLPRVARETEAGEIAVIAPGSHDTASAVAAVPAAGPDYLYISCGTWSLVGVEVKEPVINEQTLSLNFTNEGGVRGTFRLLKNVTGLWLVQECRRTWERRGEALSYAELTAMAREANPLMAVIDPDHPAFLNPEDMPAAIQGYCRDTGQAVPQTKGEIVRCALESLALKYRWVLEKLEGILKKQIPVIHMVGGGTQNELLCRFTASATGRPVVAGPVEATAAGNLLVQAMAMGEVADLPVAREIVHRSFALKTYEAENTGVWEKKYETFVKLLV
ncbi:rhamnulokinase [Neomoorella thermoacetica]|uniref:rhamnulokinase n=1 Tax=Neomoorella thermoacetica TaxID=1525 RepID=UPI0008FB2412|nr:rhamnulokinase family protein [Moorella thermoacetica]APC09185.1 rhamnulokinase [Moorella thermoacetica]